MAKIVRAVKTALSIRENDQHYRWYLYHHI
jgi:hypothetical protein